MNRLRVHAKKASGIDECETTDGGGGEAGEKPGAEREGLVNR